MVEKTMLEYETKLVAKDEEISRMRMVKTGPPYLAVQAVTLDEEKLEMSLVARDAEITQLAADKNLLQHELQELQTKYKYLATEKDAATHRIHTVTHQWRIAQEMSDSMKEKNRTLTEKLQKMEREEGSLQEEQQKDRIKKLEDELRGTAAEKRALQEALRKQVENNQEHHEQLLHKEDEDKQLGQELIHVQSQLEESTAKIMALEETKQILQNELDEGKKNWETELRNKLQEEKAQSLITQQQLRQQLETLHREQQQLLTTKEYKIQELTEKLKKKRAKYDAKVVKMKEEMETLQQKTHDDATHATRQELEQKYRIKQSELQEDFAAMQHQLAAEREKGNRTIQKVFELTEEKRRIVDEHNTKVAELQQQIETLQATVNKEELVSGIACVLFCNHANNYFMYLV